MMERYCFLCQALRQRVVWVLSLLLILAIGRVSNAEIQCSVETSGYRSIPLTHVNPTRAKQMLDPLGLATISPLPGSNMVLVTGEPEQVRKTATILDVIDAADPRRGRCRRTIRLPPPSAVSPLVRSTIPPDTPTRRKPSLMYIKARSGPSLRRRGWRRSARLSKPVRRPWRNRRPPPIASPKEPCFPTCRPALCWNRALRRRRARRS
jgi:hypothetical protein